MVFVAAKSTFVLRLAFDVRIFRHVDTGLRTANTQKSNAPERVTDIGYRQTWWKSAGYVTP